MKKKIPAVFAVLLALTLTISQVVCAFAETAAQTDAIAFADGTLHLYGSGFGIGSTVGYCDARSQVGEMVPAYHHFLQQQRSKRKNRKRTEAGFGAEPETKTGFGYGSEHRREHK